MRRFSMTLVLLVAAVTTPLLARQTLDDVERRIATHVTGNAAEAIALLRRSVDINSGTMNLDGVREIGMLYRAEFDALGFATRWADGAAFDRAGHLIAERTGQGPRLLLIGHLDTVFEPDSPFQRFTMTGDSTATGPGVVDMKGGNAVILFALRALREAGVLDRMSITVVMTGDEERSGRPLDAARHDLVEAARASDIAIGFENGDSDPRTAVVSRRGSSGWRLEVTGRPAHSSQLFTESVGAGAIYEAARILNGFYDRLAGEPFLTFNPGVILGGTEIGYDAFQARGEAFGKSNVVAERAVVTGDLRALSPEQYDRAKEVMRFVAGQNRPRTEAVLTFDDGYPPLAPTDGNYRLLAAFDRASQDLGYGPVTAVNPRNAGAADISFTAGLVEMVIDGLGPGGGDDHTVDERINLGTLEMQTKRAAVLIYRLTQRPRSD